MNKFYALFNKLISKTDDKNIAAHKESYSMLEEDEGDIFTVSFSNLSPLPTTTTARYERRKREKDIMSKFNLYTEDEYGNNVGRLRVTEYDSL